MADRPGWLLPGFVALTAIDTLASDRTSTTVQQVPIYLDSRRVAAVAVRAQGGTAVLIDQAWVAVQETAQQVIQAISEATR